MKKPIIYLSTAALIAGALSTPLQAFAAEANEDNFTKEELIYTTIDRSGSVEDMYTTNVFEGSNLGLIKDFGDYEELRLLNTTHADLTSPSADESVIQTDENRVITQGKLQNRKLPWIFTFHYLLDGKEIDPEKSAGQSGTLEVEVNIQPSDESDEALMSYVDHYALQISTSMDLDTHFDLNSENGIVSTAGNQQQVQWTVLPGQSEPLTFIVDTTEFADFDWSINGAPLTLGIDKDLFDLSSFTEPLADLETGIQAVNDGSQSLFSGSTELNSGLERLLGGSQQVTNGASELYSGSQAFVSGTAQAFAKTKELENGLADLTDGSRQLQSAAGQLNQGSRQLAKQSEPFFDGLSSVDQGVSDLTQALSDIESGAQQLTDRSKSLTDGSARVLDALKTLQEKVSLLTASFNKAAELADASQNIQSGMINLDMGIENIDQSIEEYQTKLKTSGLSPSDLADQNRAAKERLAALNEQLTKLQPLVEEGLLDEAVLTDLQTAINQTEQLTDANTYYIEGSQQVIEGIKGVVQPEGDLKAGSSQLVKQYQSFNEAVTTLIENLSSISETVEPLKQAIDSLVDQYETLDEGVNQYTESTSQLSKGIQQATAATQALKTGASTLAANGSSVQSGLQRLAEGTAGLSSGSKELNNGVNAAHAGSLAFIDGLQTLHNSTRTLETGSRKLLVGTEALESGLQNAANGSDSLVSGADQLASGTSELASQTSDLPDQTEEKIDKAVAEFSNEDYQVQSFMDDRNDQTENVQFVIQYRASDTDQASNKQTETTPQEPKSLWEKFLDLFR
ncbi:hypothetical protein [Marinilactibacillus piezotolerans]|uniref:hypothetical protein n=1 Tax=Marinilactibacillus piezotolerans TaxID=258723 RepID=UPI0009AF5E59|nr:hypothetical protein [Marinilactibacillus piezotolerans]